MTGTGQLITLAVSALIFAALLLVTSAALREQPRSLTLDPEPPTQLRVVEDPGDWLRKDDLLPMISPCIIGSGPDVTLLVRHESVRPRHCRLAWHERDGSWIVDTLEPDAVVTVASARVAFRNHAKVGHGKEIKVGEVIFCLLREDES